MRTCDICGSELEPVFPDLISINGVQYNNALDIVFGGGYGMFDDPMRSETASTAVLCHDCAHEFVRRNPWVRRWVNDHAGHTHNGEIHEENPVT